ncbi:MAG: molecular chaperone HtpG [Bacteroidia bacterium]|nr:molecular chaperone HtpG [Bacteroidia bacterium]
MEKGNISVSTENIFPIIKRSLYSEQEIFLRELVSNAVDAIQKIKHLSRTGEFKAELGDLKVSVAVDKEAKTITISDTGIGMTAEEVKKYLNVVAFSGAEEFIKKYQEAGEQGDIIGKFGLGFYSAFMVADKVEVNSLSHQEGVEAVRWINDGSIEYSIEKGERESRGTDVILHVSEDATEYLENVRIRNILDKYAKFLPVEIHFEDEVINNPNPIWRKAPSELEDKDYQEFFKELYPFDQEPLFWIHLNVDFPFNLTGVLYFPKIRNDIDPKRNNIKLFSRQVFITDEVNQIVPDYLMLLQGVIDSPDIPLNVSRSYLQGDPNVKKISNYITRKVGDKLLEIFREDRGKFEEKWKDINIFVKYGMVTDEKFKEKAQKFALYQNMDGNYFTFDEYKEKIAGNQTDKDENLVVLYATNKEDQDIFISSALGNGYDVLLFDGIVDNHFIDNMERQSEKVRFVRVDSDTVDKLVPKEDDSKDEGELVLTEEQENKLKEVFTNALEGKTWAIQLGKLGSEQLPVMLTRPEFMRRMKEMASVGGQDFMREMPDSVNVVINTEHPLVQGMIDKDEDPELVRELLDLAMLGQGMLTGKELTGFIHRSIKMLNK